MRTVLAACSSALVIAAALLAQSRPMDLSGRWQLVEPNTAERTLDTLSITSPDQLLITHTPPKIVIEHPSRPGTHPEAGSFTYGVGGTIGGIPGRESFEESFSVTHIGTQLVISRSTTHRPDEHSARTTVVRGSTWRLEGPNRLAIEFGEERAGERPKIATRVYTKITPQ
jgi:hypothetical protein